MDISKNKIKYLVSLKQQKFRNKYKKVLVEGVRIIEQLASKNILPDEIFYLENSDKKIKFGKHNIKEYNLQNYQMKKITMTDNPQFVTALYSIPNAQIMKTNFLLYLDRIQDPGNLGTIFRTVAAFDIDGIILSPECCEIFNPKVVRSSLGSVFWVPHIYKDISEMNLENQSLIVTLLEGSDLSKFRRNGRIILAIGSESQGLKAEIINRADEKITIPYSGEMESLNVAIATGICLYELSKPHLPNSLF